MSALVHGQDDTSDPDSEESSSESPTSPEEPEISSAPPSVPVPVPVPAPTPTPSAAPQTPNLPNPIFSTSDACIACQKEYPFIKGCSVHIPPAVNLTIIVQMLPFYNCMCQDELVHIDGLQTCSACFRSTGQQVFLSPQFYNVSNQQAKALKQVCRDTANGTKVPSAAGAGKWETLARSGCWMVVSLVVVMLLPLGAL
ncbi:hypothetical protein BGZ70_006229 [Mortierella alpina]|uniref:Uncharacterized protein n=1 Tax=Mortierella alpina TaxID=64518 RepID=A0A9P6J885_MORAP|nr:hypothetical protein BGZ70_006229 [Mortierella alpina]